MYKIIFFLLLIFCLTGCQSVDINTEAEENLPITIEDITEAYTESENDNYYWSFDTEESNAEAATWKNDCDFINSALSSVDWIDTVTISPSEYDEYADYHNVTIVIQCKGGTERTDDMEKSVASFIESTNAFEEYNIQYVN